MHRYRAASASIWGCQTERPIIAPWTKTMGGASGGPEMAQCTSWRTSSLVGMPSEC
jgi:hypothetical protein